MSQSTTYTKITQKLLSDIFGGYVILLSYLICYVPLTVIFANTESRWSAFIVPIQQTHSLFGLIFLLFSGKYQTVFSILDVNHQEFGQ